MNKTYIFKEFIELLTAQELSSYLSSKICHDLISPVSAINNVIELCELDGLEDDIFDLLKLSAKSASKKLQFARMAFGASGGKKSAIDHGEMIKVIKDYLKANKAQISLINIHSDILKSSAKLLLNLLVIVTESAPKCTISIDSLSPTDFIITTQADRIKLPKEIIEIGEGKLSKDDINAHNIQQYYTLALSKEDNIFIELDISDTQMVIKAKQLD